MVSCRLDCSYAILNDVPPLYSVAELPVFLPDRTYDGHSGSLHSMSLMSHFQPLLVSLSNLSKRINHKHLQDTALSDPTAQKLFLGDQICGVEQYLVGMHFDDVPFQVVRLVRLASFLYIARFVRLIPQKSRILAQLVSKMRAAGTALTVSLSDCSDEAWPSTLSISSSTSRGVGPAIDYVATDEPGTLRLLFFCATIACIETGPSLREYNPQSISSFQYEGKFWLDFLSFTTEKLQLETVTEAVGCLDDIVHVTNLCRKEVVQAFEGLRVLKISAEGSP